VNVGHPLAKSLQEEGAILAAFTLKRTTHQFIASQREVRYDLVVNNDEIMGRPKDYLKGDVFPLALINKEIGVDSIWPIVMSLRNHVRSYKDKHYYAFGRTSPTRASSTTSWRSINAYGACSTSSSPISSSRRIS